MILISVLCVVIRSDYSSISKSKYSSEDITGRTAETNLGYSKDWHKFNYFITFKAMIWNVNCYYKKHDLAFKTDVRKIERPRLINKKEMNTYSLNFSYKTGGLISSFVQLLDLATVR